MPLRKYPYLSALCRRNILCNKLAKIWWMSKVMVKPGASPATYEPKPRQMAELSKAKLYFSIGVPFEKAWLEENRCYQPGYAGGSY
jgi:zinc transport system substrate-binding protein